jgi:hypothetical protein
LPESGREVGLELNVKKKLNIKLCFVTGISTKSLWSQGKKKKKGCGKETDDYRNRNNYFKQP